MDPKNVFPKPLRTPKSNPGQKNFKRMKSRLQLKVKVDESSKQKEHEVFEEEPLSSAAPQTEGNAIADDEVLHENENKEDPGKAKTLGKKTNQSNLFNRASPMKIVRVCKNMNDAQRKLIILSDFGDILRLKCSKLIPELCRFLMVSFNPNTCELDFGARGKIPVTEQSVFRVMGVPRGTIPVPYHLDVHSTGLMMEMFGIQPGEQPSLTSIETELGPTYPADSVYLRKFIIYLTSSVFAPTTCTRVSPKCYPSVINTEAINRLNWCRFIIDTLIQTANAKDTKNWFKACMPYLMILYVDSLETDAIDVPQDGTRACVWTNKLIKLIVDMDTNSDGSFGKLPLKVCFRNNFSLFTSDSASVDMFIKCHVAGIQDEETLAKYRKPVIEMCTVFEDGLAKFLISLSENNVKATFPEHNLEVNEQKEKPKRRGVRRRPELKVEAVNVKDEQISGMNIDEEKVKSEAAVHKTEAKKRKPNDDRITGGRAGKKTQAEPEIEVIQDSNTHNTAIKSMGEEEEMAVPNRQVHAMTPGLVTGSSISAAEVGELAQPSDQDGRGIQKSCIDPLKLLQCYGSGSQSSAETVGEGAPVSHMPPLSTENPINQEKVQGGSSCETQLIRKNAGKRKKSVSFADDVTNSSVQNTKTIQNEEMESSNIASTEIKGTPVTHLSNEAMHGSPTGRRPITRSMSPSKLAAPSYRESQLRNEGQQENGGASKSSPTPQRSPRLATSDAMSSRNTSDETETGEGHVYVDQARPLTSFENSSMSRKLDLGFGSAQTNTETEKKRKRRELIEDCPSFDLGLDFSQETACDLEVKDPPTAVVEEVVVVSSNEDSGDSLDKIYANIEMPSTTPVRGKAPLNEETTATPAGPNSYTPVPQAHQKRVVKPTNVQKSPFLDIDKKTVATKWTNEVYTRVCKYGGDPKDEAIKTLNKEKIIDYGSFYIYLGDLADSVKPGAWLSNSTCEVALAVLSSEMETQRKHVMPLRLADKLRSATCIHDRFVKKMFKSTPECRLDHKDQVLFPVLQDLTPDIKEFNGHYYLIVLNLKAERFEVMDSLRREGNKSLMNDARPIIASIKHLWEFSYGQTNINIAKWRTQHITTSMQKTTFDCGYFMLKFIELWTGRQMPPINSDDMPAIRKLFMMKWIHRVENKIDWQNLLRLNT